MGLYELTQHSFAAVVQVCAEASLLAVALQARHQGYALCPLVWIWPIKNSLIMTGLGSQRCKFWPWADASGLQDE